MPDGCIYDRQGWALLIEAKLRSSSTSGQIDFVTTGNYHRVMKTVGVKQLKARLSEYLRLAKTGETVLVTERDEVIAELRSARRQTPVGDRIEEILDALASAGEITRASQPKSDWMWRVGGLGLPPGTAQVLLDELRQERSGAGASDIARGQ